MIRKILQRLKTRKHVTTFDVYRIENKSHFLKVRPL